jgi:hypothetical protein
MLKFIGFVAICVLIVILAPISLPVIGIAILVIAPFWLIGSLLQSRKRQKVARANAELYALQREYLRRQMPDLVAAENARYEISPLKGALVILGVAVLIWLVHILQG